MRAFILPFLLVPALAAAQTPMATAQKLADAERKATLTKNWAWFEKNQTADFVEITKDGTKVSKAASLAQMKQMQGQMDMKALTAKVTKARMAGKDLVSVVQLKAVGQVKGPDGKAHTFEFNGTTEETWTKVGGAWQMKRQKTLTEGGKVDGRSIG